MNRILLCCAIFVFTLGTAGANEAVRAAQGRLKDGGFYFGEVNGVYDSETSSAVSRYQIRNGLPISGSLDPETAKSLGVAASTPAADAPAPADSASWQRLRKADQRFLSRRNSGQARPPATQVPQVRSTSKQKASPGVTTAPASEPATATSLPAETTQGTTLVLSQERLRDYVGAFVLAGLDPRVGAELEFFADRVNYYDQGVVSRDKIRKDLKSYNQRWPQRRFWLAGEVKITPQPDSSLRVTFPLRYQLSNARERSSGKVQKTLNVEVTGEDLQIVGVSERKIR